jgi:Protein of unknown function (DUF3558)
VRNAAGRALLAYMKRIGLTTLTAMTVAALLAGCGDSSSSSAPSGSADNPVPAKQQPGSEKPSTVKPGYSTLLARQTKKPQSRFTPCNLVTKTQARAIIGTPIDEPVEAPLGPTCIYRSRDGKAFVTIAVPSVQYSKLKRTSRKRQPVTIANRAGFCGGDGKPTLYVPLQPRRVLAVAAPCPVAARFAAAAVKQLDG